MKANQILTLLREEDNSLNIKATIESVIDYFYKRLKTVGCVSSSRLVGLQSTMLYRVFVDGFDSLSTEKQSEIIHRYAKNFIKFFPKAKIQSVLPPNGFFIGIKPTKPFHNSFVKALYSADILTIVVMSSTVNDKEKDVFHLYIQFSEFFSKKFRYNILMKYFINDVNAREFISIFNNEIKNAIDLTAKAIRLTPTE